MVRFILLIILIFFVIWIVSPFLKTKGSNKTKDTVKRIINPNKSIFSQPNNIFLIIIVIIFIALAFWLLPKFGINFLALLQKVVPIVSSLRGILPF